jgi:hypothetical protein
VCGEHLVDQPTFATLWARQLHNPQAFWAPLPLPSVALDDPLFVRPIPRNSWGGAAQALTALRSSRWFDHYGKSAAHAQLMQRWCAALIADEGFRQQADPLDGRFAAADPAGYSPAALMLVDFTWRLAGISAADRQLNWNIRPDPAVRSAEFTLRTDRGRRAQMIYDARGVQLSLHGRGIARLEGGAGRLVAAESGAPLSLLSIDDRAQDLRLALPGKPVRQVRLGPQQQISLTSPHPAP